MKHSTRSWPEHHSFTNGRALNMRGRSSSQRAFPRQVNELPTHVLQGPHSQPRGEIAVRIIRALDELGVASVAVYSELDRDAPHVTRAGESYNLGDGPAAENYLSVEKILWLFPEGRATHVTVAPCVLFKPIIALLAHLGGDGDVLHAVAYAD
jgi:hypothetical protein